MSLSANPPGPLPSTTAKFIEENTCSYCLIFSRSLSDYSTVFTHGQSVKFCSPACFHQYSRDNIFLYRKDSLHVLKTEDNDKEGEDKKEEASVNLESPPAQPGSSNTTIPTDTAKLNSADQEIKLFNIEEMMNCQSLIVFLQAATFVPQIHDILFSSTVDEIYHKVKKQIEAKSANSEILESAKKESDLFDEVCLLFRNLWDLVRKDKISGRPEGLMNCIGYLNSKIQLIQKGNEGPSDINRLSYYLLILLLSLVKYLKNEDASPKQTTTTTENSEDKPTKVVNSSTSIFSNSEQAIKKFYDTFSFKNSFDSIELIEKFEFCSFHTLNEQAAVTLALSISNFDRLDYTYLSGLAWSSLLTISDLTENFISQRLIPNLEYALYDSSTKAIRSSKTLVKQIVNTNFTLRLVPILIPPNVPNVTNLDSSRLLCKFSFTISSSIFYVFAHHKTPFSQVLTAASRIIDYLLNCRKWTFGNHTQNQNFEAVFYSIKNGFNPDKVNCGEIFIKKKTPLDKIINIAVSGQNMLTGILNLKLRLKYPIQNVNLGQSFRAIANDNTYLENTLSQISPDSSWTLPASPLSSLATPRPPPPTTSPPSSWSGWPLPARMCPSSSSNPSPPSSSSHRP
jgi:hypothetical protein